MSDTARGAVRAAPRKPQRWSLPARKTNASHSVHPVAGHALQLQRAIGNQAVERHLTSLRGGGRPLSASQQAFFAPRFGRDLGHVRIHTGSRAAASASALQARAYTFGRDIVFGAGEYQPGAHAGQRLLAHELTHVIQQDGGTAAVQRQPDPDAERHKAVRQAEAELCSTDQIEAQSDAEDKLKLDSKRSAVKSYAWAVGGRDRDRIRKSRTLTKDLLQEIIVKRRFFQGEARPAYLQTIMPAVTDYADPDQVLALVNAPPCAAAAPVEEETGTTGNPCDAGQRKFLLFDEADPGNARCMNIDTDPEYKNFFDRNIARAVAFAVPGTTWENVEYNRFLTIQVFYRNGKSEYFTLSEIKNFSTARHTPALFDHVYVKRATGMIYPVLHGALYLSDQLTPNIISLKNGLTYQTKELQDLYTVLQVGGSFAAILGLYGLGVESFKASISAFRRGGPVRLPGRPLPGIGAKSRPTPAAELQSVFGELGGPQRRYRIQLVDDSTAIETPTSRSNIGIATRNAGGALTDVHAREIYVHRSLFDANGTVRKWGATLDLKQVIAHELGHGINNGGPCSLASRTGADLPGLTAVQRRGLLDDAVHISRAAATADERVSLPQLRLPHGYTPPKP